MARKKVNLAYIANDAARRATFKKRRRGLIKKVQELATLCDVPACIIIYAPHEAQPEVWPSEAEARRILHRFRDLPELEQNKRMMNQEQFLHQRVTKMMDQVKKQEEENRELELSVLMYECIISRELNHVGADDVTSLLYFLNTRLKALYEVMNLAKAKISGTLATEAAAAGMTARREMEAPRSSAMQAPPPPPPPATMSLEMAARQHWYTDYGHPSQQMTLFGNINGGASSSGGGLSDMIQPPGSVGGGSPWIMDPNMFNF